MTDALDEAARYKALCFENSIYYILELTFKLSVMTAYVAEFHVVISRNLIVPAWDDFELM